MYIVEGNIGAGKTTFLSLMTHSLLGVRAVYEPLVNWHDEHGDSSLLNNFYEHPSRWAYTIETLTMKRRFMDHLTQISDDKNESAVIMERSMYSGYYCFAANGYKNGLLSPLEWAMYSQWFTFLISQCALPRGFIYLKVDPEVSYERIRKRNRIGEKSISFDYVRDLHLRHDSFGRFFR